MEAKQNYDFIDLCKFLSSFLVVSIHTNIFASLSESFNNYFVNAFCRLAVYFYFMVSSFLFFSKLRYENGKIAKDKNNLLRLKRYMIRVSLLYLIWSSVYLLWYIFGGMKEGWLSIIDLAWYMINTVLSTSYYHLWFLISLIYAIPIIYLFLRHIRIKTLIILSSVFYIIGLLYGSYSFVLGINLPFVDIYQTINEYWPRIFTVVFNVIPICTFALIRLKWNTNNKIFLFISFIVFALYSMEFLLINKISPDTVSAYLVLTIPATFCVFYLTKVINVELRHHLLYRKMSTIIYCIHPLIIGIVGIIIPDTLNSFFLFLLVSIASLIISYVIVKLSATYKVFHFLRLLQ